MDIMRPFEEAMRGRQSVTEFSRQLFEQLERMGTAQKSRFEFKNCKNRAKLSRFM